MSDRHGLFVYHPWYFAALVCCIAAVRSEATRQLALGALASFVLLACANGTWWAWWFGDSFGNRAFVEIIPALALTASAWLSTRTRHARAVAATASVVAFLAAANALLWSGYILRQYPADGRHTAAQAWLWPWR